MAIVSTSLVWPSRYILTNQVGLCLVSFYQFSIVGSIHASMHWCHPSVHHDDMLSDNLPSLSNACEKN